MRRRSEIPPALGPVFTTADAAAHGVSAARLRGDDLHTPTRGVRCLAEPTTLIERASAVAPMLPPDAAFSHETAAHLLGIWMPTNPGVDAPLHVTHPGPGGKVRRRGVVAHPVTRPRAFMQVAGLPVTHPADTWADLARTLTLDDLVIAGDSLRRFRAPMAEWADICAARDRLRYGRSRAAEALQLVREGSASAMETRTRLLVVRAGLPEPELNATICAQDGSYIGAFDLVWRDRRVVLEYDGDQHRTDRDQWQRDHERLQRLRDEGWTVLTARWHDIVHRPDVTLTRLRTALRLM